MMLSVLGYSVAHHGLAAAQSNRVKKIGGKFATLWFRFGLELRPTLDFCR